MPRYSPPGPITVRVWENDYGVPSIDADSLHLLTLFKMNGVDVTVVYATIPQWQNIPSFQCHSRNLSISQRCEVFAHAMSICKADMALTTSLGNQIVVYKSYFKKHFVDAFMVDRWINEANYEHMTKNWYSNAMLYPFSYLYLRKKRREVQERFKSLPGSNDTEKFIAKLYEDASRCLEDFNNLLIKDRRYLLSYSPTSLDALVYSYLAILINIPLPDPTLQNMVKSHSRLELYVRQITQCYFPDTPMNIKYVEPLNASNDRASTRSLILAAMCASAGMLLYAYAHGLVRLRIPKFLR